MAHMRDSTRTPLLRHRLLWFLGVGAVVFGVDITVLHLLTGPGGVSPFTSRLVSLPIAASLGWVLHRKVTFADRQHRRITVQWPHYLMINVVSGTANFGIYVGLIGLFPWLREHLVLAVMPAAATGTLINFVSGNFWVFR